MEISFARLSATINRRRLKMVIRAKNLIVLILKNTGLFVRRVLTFGILEEIS